MGQRQFFPWGVGNPTFYLAVLTGVATVGTGVLAITEDTGTAITTGIAAFMAGGIFGFLFGIPRYAASATERDAQAALGDEVVKYKANTNLEQISDWLTKILVGLGLTQFDAIGRTLHSVAENVGGSLTGAVSAAGTVEAAGLILLSTASGFLFFYLWSRVYLPKMFKNAEKEA